MAVSAPIARGRKPWPIEYPTGDGKPMSETDKHFRVMVYLNEALRLWFADRPDVYVAGNNFLYWKEGDPRAVVSPDTYVVFGVSNKLRDCYMAWMEGGRLPSLVVEATSKKTRAEDVNKKRPIYERTLRVPEYIQFDPTGDYLSPRLQGQRLRDGVYVPIPLSGDRLHSEELGLDFVVRGEEVRLFDPFTRKFLPTIDEERSGRLAAEARADQAESEIERLLAELDALKRS